MKGKQRIVVPIIILVAIVFTSYGYAALNTELQLSGEGYVRVDENIRITNLKLSSITDGGYETYNSKYSKNTNSMFVTLPANGSAIYEVEVTNKSTDDYFLKSIKNNLDYELIDTKIYDVFQDNSTRKFYIKVTNNGTSEKNISLNLEYEFQKDEDPTIALADLPAWNTKGDDYAFAPTYNAGPSGGTASCKSNLNTDIDNVTDLKYLTTTGTHNITCTVKSNTGKTASVTKSTKITYDPYLITNMITNNSFEDSFTGWTGNGKVSTTISHSGTKSFYINDPDNETAVWLYQPLKAPAGHKMFISVYVRYTKESYIARVGFSNKGSNNIAAIFTEGNVNQWMYDSFIIDMPSDRETFQTGSSQAVAGTFYMDDFLVFDLTEIFGEGLEPDKKWCDKHIKYFDGTTTIYK